MIKKKGTIIPLYNAKKYPSVITKNDAIFNGGLH